MTEATTPDAGDARKDEGAAPPRSTRTELAFLGVLSLVLASFLWQILSLRMFAHGSVGAGFYPLCVVSILIGLVLLRAVRLIPGLRERRGAGQVGAITARQAVLAALVCGAIAVGTFSSLIVSLALFLLSGLLAIERVGLRRALLFTLGSLIAVYLIFDLWLGMNIGLNGLF